MSSINEAVNIRLSTAHLRITWKGARLNQDITFVYLKPAEMRHPSPCLAQAKPIRREAAPPDNSPPKLRNTKHYAKDQLRHPRIRIFLRTSAATSLW